MKLIVGLGNPGARYSRSRHNVGFRVVDHFAARHRIGFDRHHRDAYVGVGRVAGRAVTVAKPQTFMNLSGKSVAGLLRAHGIDLEDLLVVYDDIDLPLGRLRIRESGSAGSHNGMRSLLDELASDRFPRLRFGIRGSTWSAERDLASYVLEDFEQPEEAMVEQMLQPAADALLLFVRDELRRAMNEFNRELGVPEDVTP